MPPFFLLAVYSRSLKLAYILYYSIRGAGTCKTPLSYHTCIYLSLLSHRLWLSSHTHTRPIQFIVDAYNINDADITYLSIPTQSTSSSSVVVMVIG